MEKNHFIKQMGVIFVIHKINKQWEQIATK